MQILLFKNRLIKLMMKFKKNKIEKIVQYNKLIFLLHRIIRNQKKKLLNKNQEQILKKIKNFIHKK